MLDNYEFYFKNYEFFLKWKNKIISIILASICVCVWRHFKNEFEGFFEIILLATNSSHMYKYQSLYEIMPIYIKY